MKITKSKKNFAFIDSQNLNLGVRSQGWKLDWRKFRQYLRNKYDVSEAYLFIGHVPGNEPLYAFLKKCGYILIFKPTLDHKVRGKKIVKGNVDAELVLHTMIQFKNYDRAVIVSGDGDFHCLAEYLIQKDKLLHIMTPNKNYSKLLREFSGYVVQVDWLRGSLENKSDWHQRSVETLGLSSHRDKPIIQNHAANVKRQKVAKQKVTKINGRSKP